MHNMWRLERHLFSAFFSGEMIWAYLSHQVQTEMVLDVPPEALGEVLRHLAFINATHRCPLLPLIITHSLPETQRQFPPPHPPLYVPHF